MGGGFWGVLAVPFFDSTQGLFHQWNRKSLLLLGWNLCGVVVIGLWTATVSGILFGTLYGFNQLRVPKEVEIRGKGSPALCVSLASPHGCVLALLGLDYDRHGELAYSSDSHSVLPGTNRRPTIRSASRSTSIGDLISAHARDQKTHSVTFINRTDTIDVRDGNEDAVSSV